MISAIGENNGPEKFEVDVEIVTPRRRFTTRTLIDTGNQTYSNVVDKSLARELIKKGDASTLPLPKPKILWDYNRKHQQKVTEMIFPRMVLQGHEDNNAPMLIADLGEGARYQMIVSQGYLANHGAVLDCVEKRIMYKEGFCLHTGAEKALYKVTWYPLEPRVDEVHPASRLWLEEDAAA